MTDATQEGVSQRDQVIANLKKQQATEETPEVEPEVEEEIKEEPEQEEIPDEAAVETIQFKDGDTVYEVPKTAAATLKIDGEEIETPLDTAFRRYQKGAAGDKRLQEANDIRKALEDKQKILDQREQELLERLNQDNPDLSNDDRKGLARAIINARIEDDEESLATVLDKITPKVEPKIDESLITRTVDERVQAGISKIEQQRQSKKLLDARAKFESDYPELVKDQMLFDMVDRETFKIGQERPGAEPSEIITEAAERVKDWLGKMKPKPPKKRTVPTPASGRASIGEDEKPPPTLKETINKMRISRGYSPQ